ncbi:MAG: exosortase [Acidobacteria bacterium]|nr:exosortase [Acidobacteriota bacterium]
MEFAADPLPATASSAETGPPPIPWVQIGVVFALLVLCYFPVLRHLVGQWNNEPDYSHGFFVPVVAGYIAWTQREQLLRMPAKANLWGLAILAWGAGQLILGTVGAELFLQRTAFLISIVGCIYLLCGVAVVRKLAFPLVMLLFMVPPPQVVFNQITFPLQLLATRVAEWALNALNIPALRDGNVLELANQKLSVVEACSGIRSLLSLSFLSLVYAFFFDKKVWMRWVLFLFTIPIAIVANAGRVTVTGILSYYQPELAQGFFHSLEGWVIFIVDLIFLMAVHQAINFAYRRTHATTIA